MMASNSNGMPQIPRYYDNDRELVVLAQQVTRSPAEIELASLSDTLLGDRPRTEQWKLASKVRDDSDTNGMVAATFVDEQSKKVVIAYRGADQDSDTIGPLKELLVDGELLSLAGSPINPKGDRPREQMADLQEFVYEKVLRQDAWHPQFDAALDYAKSVRDHYEPLGYTVRVTGYGLGASEAQLAAHTLGLGGRTFEPYGAQNLTESEGYKTWLARNGVETPPGPAARPYDDVLGEGFLNYNVRLSPLSSKSGAHLGPSELISAFAGREDPLSYLSWADATTDAVLSDLPGSELLAGVRIARSAGGAAREIAEQIVDTTVKQGKDIEDRRSLDRIVRVFDEAAKTGHLPRWGAADPSPPVDTRLAELAGATLPSAVGFPADDPNAPLYAKVRGMLPDSVSDAQAAQVTLHARRDAEISGPHELQKIVVDGERAFVGGTLPGFRCAVDLAGSPPSIADTVGQLREFDQQLQQRTAQQALAQSENREPPAQRSL